MLEIALFLISVFVVSLSGAMAPGPVTATAITLGTKNKYAGVFISLGHAIIEVPLVLLVVSDFCDFLMTPPAKITIGLAGGMVLLWMGRMMLKDAKKAGGYETASPAARTPILAGLLLSAGNPYFLLWWLTVGVKFATDAIAYNWLVLVAFICTHLLVDLVWVQTLSFAGYKGAKIMSERTLKAVLSTCAFALIAFGIYFIFDAARIIHKFT